MAILTTGRSSKNDVNLGGNVNNKSVSNLLLGATIKAELRIERLARVCLPICKEVAIGDSTGLRAA